MKVIGDSSGLVTSTKLLTNKGNFSVLREVEAVVKIPLKFIHVITNPFDDIASIVTKQSQQGKKVCRLSISVRLLHLLATSGLGKSPLTFGWLKKSKRYIFNKYCVITLFEHKHYV